jgi:predicted dehydrogenase
VEVVAVASRTAAKAQAFADELRVPRVLDSYDALLADESIDAIYVPLPNSMHCEWAIRSMQAGKHVLCEKPLGVSVAEAREMFAAAERYGRHLVEAYPYLAQPYTIKARELIRDGALGELKLIQACFAFPLSDASSPIRLDRALGGGALFDVGCYPISFIRMLIGARPARVHAIARWGDTTVDRTLIASLDFANGVLAQISCSFDTALHRRALIAGTDGVIDTTYYNHTVPERPAEFQLKRGRTWAATTETIALPLANGFRAEAEAFADLVAGNASAWPGPHAAESIDIALTLDAIAESARSGQPIDLAR